MELKRCATPDLTLDHVRRALGGQAENMLGFSSPMIERTRLHLPSLTFIDDVFGLSGRSIEVRNSLRAIRDHGRLSGTGYMSILPVDQGVEHDWFTFARNLDYADPANIVRLAEEGGCNAVATSYGAASIVADMAAKLRLPVIVKINHNELLTTPAKYDQTMFATAKAAADMGARAIGITIYFGSEESRRQMEEVRDAFQAAREAGLATIAWCYLRNSKAFKIKEDGKDAATDFHDDAALTSQAIHLAASLGADIVKQKLATRAGGPQAIRAQKIGVLNSKDDEIARVVGTHPIDWVRAQVAAAYMGRIGLINSGGESKGASDLDDAIATAVINLRAGGTGLISGRKAFQKPMAEGIALLHAIQDVYLLGVRGEISIP